jgi:hypothetical protein
VRRQARRSGSEISPKAITLYVTERGLWQVQAARSLFYTALAAIVTASVKRFKSSAFVVKAGVR